MTFFTKIARIFVSICSKTTILLDTYTAVIIDVLTIYTHIIIIYVGVHNTQLIYGINKMHNDDVHLSRFQVKINAPWPGSSVAYYCIITLYRYISVTQKTKRCTALDCATRKLYCFYRSSVVSVSAIFRSMQIYRQLIFLKQSRYHHSRIT